MGLPKDFKIDYYRKFECGARNAITDVGDITVGHTTIISQEKNIYTGVTAILPHSGNIFRKKVRAGAHVINGFGKSVGILQIQELGNIETPILLSNTFAVGTCLNALTKHMLDNNPEIGTSTGTVNCIVTECNDGSLNDIRGFHVSEKDVFYALENASKAFDEGAVGGGTGMICMGLKGGIGSSSRVFSYGNENYTVGALVMSNCGELGNLRINGKLVKPSPDLMDSSEIDDDHKVLKHDRDKGSIIIVIATDLPLNTIQLNRLAKRATASLGRVGSFIGNGSGDISIAFSTSNTVNHFNEHEIIQSREIPNEYLDTIFEAACETVDESVISSLFHGKTTVGIRNKKVYGLSDWAQDL